MARPKKHYKDVHDNEFYPKLTESYAEKLVLHAQKLDVPPNVLARMLIVKAIDEVELNGEFTLKNST